MGWVCVCVCVFRYIRACHQKFPQPADLGLLIMYHCTLYGQCPFAGPTRCQSGLSTAVDHSLEQSSGHRCKVLMRVVIISVKQMKTYVAATAELERSSSIIIIIIIMGNSDQWGVTNGQWAESILISNELWAQRMWVALGSKTCRTQLHCDSWLTHSTTMKVNKILQEWTHHSERSQNQQANVEPSITSHSLTTPYDLIHVACLVKLFGTCLINKTERF